MTDKYADLRAALDTLSAETEGRNGIPWFDTRQVLREEVTGEFDRELPPIPETDMAYITAAHPGTIRALLADYDCLRKAAAQVDALYPNVWDLVDGGLFIMPENVKRFDDTFDALRAALAQEQGGSDAPHA